MSEERVELREGELRERIVPVHESDERGGLPRAVKAPGRDLHVRRWIAKDPLEALTLERRTFAAQQSEIREPGVQPRHAHIASGQPAVDGPAWIGSPPSELPAPHELLQLAGTPHANHASRRHRSFFSCPRIASAPSGRYSLCASNARCPARLRI